MKILIHDYAGHPFQVQLARALAGRGHEVMHAFATALQTPRGELAPRRDDPPWLTLQPVEMDPDYARHKYSFRRRRRMEIDYGRKVAALVSEAKPHVVLSSNTPTETQQPIIQAALLNRSRFYFWAQDFYSLAVDRLVRKKIPVVGPLIGGFYKWLEKGQLRHSDGVVAITGDFQPIMQEQFRVPAEKIEVIPNWAPLESLPVRFKKNPWSLSHGLTEKFVFLYTGTLGMKHNPALLLELARRHHGDDRVRVVVVSEGIGADWLRENVVRDGLTNVLQLPYQPFESLPDMLATGDVLIGVLEEDAGVFSVPSKILTYLCAQRPILLAAPEVNLATRTVRAEKAGLTVAPSDTAGFLQAADTLLRQPTLAAGMARHGRSYAERSFRIDDIATRFEAVLGIRSKPALGSSGRTQPLTGRAGVAALPGSAVVSVC